MVDVLARACLVVPSNRNWFIIGTNRFSEDLKRGADRRTEAGCRSQTRGCARKVEDTLGAVRGWLGEA